MIAKTITRFIKGVSIPVFALLLNSCYETKQEITLNPDGSGKVLHECSFQNMNLNLNNGDDNPEEALQAAIARIVKDSKGVDAWNDVTFKRLDDGRLWFRGTAYFKKLDDLEIQNQSMLSFAWKNQGGGKGVLSLDLKKSDDDKPKPDDAKLTPEERAKKITEERAKFQQMKPMVSAMLGSLKQTVSFKLPGKLASSSNMKPAGPDTIGLTFEGAKMIEALEKLMADDAWLAKNGFDAEKSPELDNELGGLLFGEKAPVKATVTGAVKPMFDYAAEVAAAHANAGVLEKQLGVVSIAPPAKGDELKFVRVTGVRMAREVDKKLDLRPFNQDPGFTLAVLVGFPGSILEITDKSAITKATASDGSSLLKGERDWDRRLGFPKLSADNAAAAFDLELKLPPPDAKGIKEISGVIQYRVAEGTKEVRLGPMAIEPGAKDEELGAVIKEIKEGWNKDGSQDMELKVKLGPQDLKSAHLMANGEKIELETGGYSSSGGITSFTLKSAAKLPEKGEIILDIHDGIKTYEVPFTLENLSLLGTPLGADA